jgi:competence protein ComEC
MWVNRLWANRVALLCLAYVTGLLLTGVSGKILGLPIAAIASLLAGAIVPVILRFAGRWLKWRSAPKPIWWLAAGLVGLLAALYFDWRQPQPAATDICRLLNSPNSGICAPIAAAVQPEVGQKFQVSGTISTVPRLTRSDRYKFQLEAAEVSAMLGEKWLIPQQAIGGSVYVTLPHEQGEALYPGLKVTVIGSLYKPQPALNPGGFDFQKYLAKSGVFVGLMGKDLQLNSAAQPSPPIAWALRQRIVRSQEAGLGETEGHLLSAVAIGKSAVDVSTELQDEFRKAGLTHALAASGAQVSLLIGVVIALTRRFGKAVQCAIGLGTIGGYIALTGAEASVLRAGIMGAFVLIALSLDRKVIPLGSLLAAATGLLVYDPALIWDLGFQLSFLATLGLLVTVPILSKWLDWMPSAIAPLFAVPIAASLWTLPIQLFSFSIFLPYSILINAIVGGLIAIVSLGGMASALLALVYPPLGSVSAALLHYPLWLFIAIARWGNQLPGSQYAIGTISPLQLILLYGLIGLIWQWKRLQPYWGLALLLGVSLVAIPAGVNAANLQQVTLLATAGDPVLVIQDKGTVLLINTGDEQETRFTILPFLQRQGINRIDGAIAPALKTADFASWQQIAAVVPIRAFYHQPASLPAIQRTPSHVLSRSPARSKGAKPTLVPSTSPAASAEAIAFQQAYAAFLKQLQALQIDPLRISVNQPLRWNSTTVKSLTADGAALHLGAIGQEWLLLNSLRSADYRRAKQGRLLPRSPMLWWKGHELDPALLQAIDPQVAIAPELRLKPNSVTQTWLNQHQVQVYPIAQTGALRWRDRGVHAAAESND